MISAKNEFYRRVVVNSTLRGLSTRVQNYSKISLIAQRMSTFEFSVAMTCEGCSGSVQRVLAKLGDRISKVDIDLDGRLVFVTTESMSGEEILEVINKTGLESKLIGKKE